MLKQIIATALLSCALITPQISSIRMDTTTWLKLHPNEPIYGVTMKVGDKNALVNGVEVELQGAPFVEEDVFYYPLQDLVELYGDSYDLNGDQVTISARDYGVYTFTVGSTTVTAQDSTVWDNNSQNQQYFLTSAPSYREEPIRAPLLRDNVVYVPYGFTLNYWDGPQYFKAGTQYVDSNFVIFSDQNLVEEFLGFGIKTKFDDLPAGQKASLQCLGVKAETAEVYQEVEYRGDGFSVFVFRLKEGESDARGLDGLISAITTDDARYATHRGLRVGDSAERAWELYGYDLIYEFGYEVKDGVVTRLGFHAPYYSACGIYFRYLQLT